LLLLSPLRLTPPTWLLATAMVLAMLVSAMLDLAIPDSAMLLPLPLPFLLDASGSVRPRLSPRLIPPTWLPVLVMLVLAMPVSAMLLPLLLPSLLPVSMLPTSLFPATALL